MDLPTVLRVARQTAGLSQRELAARAGIAPSSLAKAECGRQSLRADVLDRLLEQCALDLQLVPRDSHMLSQDEHQRLVEHLLLSTTQRLYLALGGTAHWSTGPHPESYAALVRRAGAALRPQAALGVWLPGRVCHEPVDDIVDPDPQGHQVAIAIAFWWRVHVPTPLGLSASCADLDDRRLLLGAASLLAVRPARDEGGRRHPPHRTPDEATETANLMRSLTYAMHPSADLPDSRDSRGWRLEQPVSLSQLLRRDGLPVRRGSRRGA